MEADQILQKKPHRGYLVYAVLKDGRSVPVSRSYQPAPAQESAMAKAITKKTPKPAAKKPASARAKSKASSENARKAVGKNARYDWNGAAEKAANGTFAGQAGLLGGDARALPSPAGGGRKAGRRQGHRRLEEMEIRWLCRHQRQVDPALARSGRHRAGGEGGLGAAAATFQKRMRPGPCPAVAVSQAFAS